MSLPRYGSFIGTVTPNTNLVETFKAREESRIPGISPPSVNFSLLAVEIHVPEGTQFTFNGQQVKVTGSGMWRTPTFMEINEIVFSSAVEANIMYLF
jgi:hypothetical protein